MNLMSGILASMTSGVMLLDRDGRVRMINEAGAVNTPVFSHELIDRLLADALPEAGEFLKTAPRTLPGNGIRRPDGSSHRLSVFPSRIQRRRQHSRRAPSLFSAT